MRRIFSLLISGLFALACASIAAAGTATMEWAPANTTAYSAGGVVSCGVSKKVDVKVAFTGSSCSPSFGANPYQFEFFYIGTAFKSDIFLTNRHPRAGTTAYFILWMPTREPIQR